MLERNSGIIRAVAWSELCPWLNIFRTFRLAIGFRSLVMASAAILITVLGWGMIGKFFAISENDKPATAWLQLYVDSPLQLITNIVPDKPGVLKAQSPLGETPTLGSGAQAIDPIFYPFALLTQPMREGIGQSVNLKGVVCLIVCGLWSLATWSFFGAAICRIASVQLATNERISWAAALQHALSKYFSYVAAPLIPLAGIAIAMLPVFVVGLIMLLGGLGVLLAAISWPIMLVAGLVMTILLLGLLFGWPLMWGTISTEATDSFDALSRSYAYVFQRPVHYLFYALVASIFGWLGWLVVQNFASGIIWMTYWAASWGATDAHVNAVMPGGNIEGIGYAGAWLIRLWAGCVKMLAVGYLFSYFWTASVAIYFLLRRTVDATEMDEVFLDADESEKSYALPKISTDEAGAPVVEESGEIVTPDSPAQPS
jgi:hypothetical protein